ncbi:MAG: glycosyltransferase family 4 protein [Planctomycetota bacterium]|nr:glycosyltransferase family 4 protein [Planctomycetota bacterium]
MKVLQLNMHRKGGWGGQPNRVLAESIEVRARGHEVVIGGPHPNELCVRASAQGFDVFDDLALKTGLPSLSDVRKLRRYILDNDIDLVHTHGSQDTWAAALALRGMRGNVGFVRSRHYSYRIATHVFNRWLYGRMDHVIVVTPQVGEYIVSLELKTADDITSVYSVPDFERFRPDIDSEPLRSELGLSPEEQVVVCAARLAPEKGHRTLLQAFALVRKDLSAVRLVLAGKGGERANLEELAQELGIGSSVIFAGFRTDVEKFDALADVFCITPVDGEAVCTSALEAFSTETPVVATDLCGVRESVIDGETGFLLDVGDVEGVAAALVRLLGDGSLCRDMGKRGRELVTLKFSVEQLGSRTVQVYEKVMSSKRVTNS